jgi:hypothetical protein
LATWAEFERADRTIATFGRERVDQHVCFLATVRADGSPRVHPVTPWVAVGRLLVRMYPTSPKAGDLQRDPRYALHSMMDNDDGEGGEVAVRGVATTFSDPRLLADAFDVIGGTGTDKPLIVFELDIDEVNTTIYEKGEPIRGRWRA